MNKVISVLGHQFSDPIMWVKFLARRFQSDTRLEMVVEPDRALCVDVDLDGCTISTWAVVHALLHPRATYRAMIERADLVIYLLSSVKEQMILNRADSELFANEFQPFAERTPLITVLNDSYCGGWRGQVVEREEVEDLVPETSSLFEARIGYRPASGDCSVGADEVLTAVNNALLPVEHG